METEHSSCAEIHSPAVPSFSSQLPQNEGCACDLVCKSCSVCCNICVEAKGQGYHFEMDGLLAYHSQPRRREQAARIHRVYTALSLLQVLLTVAVYSRVWFGFRASVASQITLCLPWDLMAALQTHDAFSDAVDKIVKPNSHH